MPAKAALWIEAHGFLRSVEDEDLVNVGMSGSRLCAYFAERLFEQGYETGQAIGEDLGYALPVREPATGRSLFVIASATGENPESASASLFRIAPEPNDPTLLSRLLFSPKLRAETVRLRSAPRTIVAASEGVDCVAWEDDGGAYVEAS